MFIGWVGNLPEGWNLYRFVGVTDDFVIPRRVMDTVVPVPGIQHFALPPYQL
jgi:hypothetical protein